MRKTWGALWAVLAGICLASPANAQDRWVGGAPLEGHVYVGAGGETWVGVWVDAPQIAVPEARAPMAVSLVVDTSGSMAGDKIRNAQHAASSLLASLADGDVVSIYGFSSAVTEVAPPTVLGPATRGMLMQRVQLLVAGGGTNLYGGMQVGISRIAQAPPSHPIRRIFVISDGHANIGPSDPQSLGDLAAGATEWGTQVTAIGVGYDYDPQTLNAMVVRSAGRLHHLGAPQQMAAILEQELQRMASSVALNARLEVMPSPGVVILEGATTGAVLEGGALRFPLGALYSGQRREILFRVRMDTAHTGTRTLGTVRLVYESPDARAPRTQTAEVRYEVTRDRALAGSAPTPRVAAMVAQHDASVAERRAAALVAQGQAEQAARALDAARAELDRTARTYDFDDDTVAGELAARSSSLSGASARTRASTTADEQRARSYELQAAPMAAEGY